MIIYLSGFRPEHFYKIGRPAGVKHWLYSFFTLSDGMLGNRKQEGDKIFVDSGGYTARIRGKKIDIKEYAEFLAKHKDFIDVAANLDTQNVDETQQHYKYLKANAQGVKILPVYHLSDWMSPKHRGLLDEFMKETDYIALGGMAGVKVSRETVDKFLRYCFAKTKGKWKLHGFGMTGKKILYTYPFYSVDSTSWQAGMRFGVTKSQKTGTSMTFRDKEDAIHNDIPKELIEGDYLTRLPYDIEYWLSYEREIAELWRKRGIVWKD